MIFNLKFSDNLYLSEVFKYLGGIGNFYFTAQNIYLSTELSKNEIILSLKEIVKDQDTFYLQEINGGNFFLQPEVVQNWIKDIENSKKLEEVKKVKEDITKNSEEMEKIYTEFVDFMEDFQKQLEEKRKLAGKEENNGKTKNEENT